MSTSTPTDFQTIKAQAGEAFARMINGQSLGHDQPDAPQFLNATVTVDTDLANEFGDGKQHNEVIRLTIDAPELDQFPSKTRKVIEKVLQSIEPVDEFVRARSAEEEVEYTKEKLEELIKAGANVPKETLKWAGFDKANESRHEIKEHLIRLESGDAITRVDLDLPRNLPDGLEAKDIVANLEDRIDAIKEAIVERLIKLANKEGRDTINIREQVNALDFEVEHKERSGFSEGITHHDIAFVIRSAEQKQEHDNAKAEGRNANYEGLKETNVLSSFDLQGVTKAISKAVQTAGDTAKDVMPVIAGASDVRHMLEKKLKAFEKDHPEYSHQIADVLNSDVLVGGWKEEDTKFTKHPVTYKKDADTHGKLVVEMTVPENEASKIIQKVAAMAPAAGRFASVESITPIAVVPHPDVDEKTQAAIHEAFAPLAGKTFTPEEAADQMKPFAERLIELGQEAHALKAAITQPGVSEEQVTRLTGVMMEKIDDINTTIAEGIKTGAQQAAQADGASQAAQAYAYANASNDDIPSPTMVPDSITKLASRVQGSSVAMG